MSSDSSSSRDDNDAIGHSASTSLPVSVSSSAGTSSEIANLYRYVDTRFDVVDRKMSALQSEMKGEIAMVMAEFKTAEAQRHTDYSALTASLNSVKGDLPTKADISKTTRNWALGLGGFMVALAALLWAFFDTGAGITGSFAEQIIETEQRQQEILDRLPPPERSDESEAGN